jgi:PhnB protein
MAKMNPYLNFNGQCREAMNFYKECFGGELNLVAVKDTPMAERCPAGSEDQIMHSSLTNNDMVIMGTDMTPPDGLKTGNNFALSLNCASEEETHALFNKISAGGKVIEPVKPQFWGALFGMTIDRFGIPWMINCDQSK